MHPADPFDEDADPKAPLWLVTYSDMMTLLLALFVVIVSMSSIQESRLQEFLYSLSPGGPSDAPPRTEAPPKDSQQARQRAEGYEDILRIVQREKLGDHVAVSLTEAGPHVVITDSVMFASGRTELIEPSRSVLLQVARALQGQVEGVVVTGYTDDQPIRNSTYPSNWELSAARAASVVRYMQEHTKWIKPEHYTAVGRGEFYPIAPNATPEGRGKNRRVEILFRWKQWQKILTPPPSLPAP